MSVHEFKRPEAPEPEAPEPAVRMTAIERAKIEYAGKKLGIPVDFPLQTVKYRWQATATAADFGISIDKYGQVITYDEDLNTIQTAITRQNLRNLILLFTFTTVFFGLLFLT